MLSTELFELIVSLVLTMTFDLDMYILKLGQDWVSPTVTLTQPLASAPTGHTPSM